MTTSTTSAAAPAAYGARCFIECTCSSLSIGFGGDAGGAGGASGAAMGGAAKLGFVFLRPPRLTLRNSESVTKPSPFGSHSRKIARSSSLVRALLSERSSALSSSKSSPSLWSLSMSLSKLLMIIPSSNAFKVEMVSALRALAPRLSLPGATFSSDGDCVGGGGGILSFCGVSLFSTAVSGDEGFGGDFWSGGDSAPRRRGSATPPGPSVLALTAYGVRRLRMVNDSRVGFLEGGGRWTHLR